MTKRVISAAWDDAVVDLKRDGRTYLIIAVALIMLPYTLLGVVDPEQVRAIASDGHEPSTLASILDLIANLLSLLAQITIAILVLPNNETVGSAMKRGLKLLLPVVGAVLILILPLLLAITLILGSSIGFDNLALGATVAIDAKSMSLGTSLSILATMAAFIFIAIRASLMVPAAAAAERAGSIRILRRSWELTNGRFWKLFGFFLLLGLALIVLFGSVLLIAGILVTLIFGAPEPFTAGALFSGLAAGFVQAMAGLISSVVLANIYQRLAAISQPSPPVER